MGADMLDTQLYSLTSTAPDGRQVVTHDHTAAGAKRMALLLRSRRGHHSFAIQREPETPVPDAMLCPCAQPAVVAEGQV